MDCMKQTSEVQTGPGLSETLAKRTQTSSRRGPLSPATFAQIAMKTEKTYLTNITRWKIIETPTGFIDVPSFHNLKGVCYVLQQTNDQHKLTNFTMQNSLVLLCYRIRTQHEVGYSLMLERIQQKSVTTICDITQLISSRACQDFSPCISEWVGKVSQISLNCCGIVSRTPLFCKGEVFMFLMTIAARTSTCRRFYRWKAIGILLL